MGRAQHAAQSRFFVVPEVGWPYDKVAEWFPVLAERRASRPCRARSGCLTARSSDRLTCTGRAGVRRAAPPPVWIAGSPRQVPAFTHVFIPRAPGGACCRELQREPARRSALCTRVRRAGRRDLRAAWDRGAGTSGHRDIRDSGLGTRPGAFTAEEASAALIASRPSPSPDVPVVQSRAARAPFRPGRHFIPVVGHPSRSHSMATRRRAPSFPSPLPSLKRQLARRIRRPDRRRSAIRGPRTRAARPAGRPRGTDSAAPARDAESRPRESLIASELSPRRTTSMLVTLEFPYVPTNRRSVSTFASAAGTRRLNTTTPPSIGISARSTSPFTPVRKFTVHRPSCSSSGVSKRS